MCGINGIISKKRIDGLEKRIKKMNISIQHRGPDAQGYDIPDCCTAFGHCRLSIIDTNERASQPMKSNSGRWIVVFNGEIYNYQELKREVNYEFRTTSDTEVILAYVEEYGVINFLKKSNGMFALALYDKEKDEIWFARDRLGIKPFYYYNDGDIMVFSSEIKGILNSGLVEAQFYESAIDEYLGNRYVREPYTFFKNIYQLEAGHYIKTNRAYIIKKHKYWELTQQFNMSSEYDEEELKGEFGQRIEAAIKIRLMSDVPLGTYLSGGVDSSLISAIVASFTNQKVNTYTIGFPVLNEFPYAKIVADKYQTKHHEILISNDDYLNAIQEIISYKDAPLGVPNEVMLAEMSRVLKKDITVVLSGEGADELMGGYGRIFRSAFDYKNTNYQSDFYSYFISKYEYVPRDIRNRYLKTPYNMREEFDKKIQREFQGIANEENIFRFFHNYHVKGLLQRVDVTTMLASIESRVPFLDHTLVEFAYKNVPYDLKLHWNSEADRCEAKKESSEMYSEIRDTPKYLLRQYARQWIPDEIIDRKKMGFPVPLNDWMGKLGHWSRKLFCDAQWIKREAISELIHDCERQQRAGQILWMFINVELFRQMYFNKEWRY